MKGDLYDFFNALGERESNNDYKIVNTLGYLGRWQFGKPRLYDLGISIDGYHPKDRSILKIISKEKFLGDVLLQDMCILKSVRLYKRYFEIREEYQKLFQTKVNGVLISLSGLIAGAHLLGPGGVADFFKGNIKQDAYGTKITEYIEKFGQYNLSE